MGAFLPTGKQLCISVVLGIALGYLFVAVDRLVRERPWEAFFPRECWGEGAEKQKVILRRFSQEQVTCRGVCLGYQYEEKEKVAKASLRPWPVPARPKGQTGVPKPRIQAPLPISAKIVNSRYVCAKKHDKPGKSKKNKRGHIDLQCCLDPDEKPNPHCDYSYKW